MWQQQWNIILTHIFDQNWVGCPLDVDWPLGSGNLAVHCDCWDKFTGFHEAEGAQKLSRPWPIEPRGGLNESQPSTAWFLEVGGLPAFRVTLLA